MQIGIIGLGRMGANMARRLIKGEHEVVVFNRSLDKVEALAKEGAIGAQSLKDFVDKLSAPRIVWMMLPTGNPIDDMLETLTPLLAEEDIIIEGGNSYYKDDLRRAEELKEQEIHYLDAGVSGGIWGLKVGYCTMVGGEKEIFKYIEPLLKTLATEGGYLYCGPSGAGHFVKMIHNGIEYAMMEAYGEGFEILKASPYGKELDLADVSHLWNQGSVVRSWLLELLESAFKKDPDLSEIEGYVEDSGEGRWAVMEAIESGVAATGMAHSLFKRFLSRQKDPFSDKVLAALRNEFGGHAVAKKGEDKRVRGAGAGEVKAASADERK